MSNTDEIDVDNISEEELYKLAVSYFKENEGKNFHIAYQEKLHLIALTQQASQGSIESASLPALGTFDIIGKERRSAWEALGNISKEEAKEKFSSKLLDLSPGFKDYIITASRKNGSSWILARCSLALSNAVLRSLMVGVTSFSHTALRRM